MEEKEMSAEDRGWGPPKPYGSSVIVNMTVQGSSFPAGVNKHVKAIMESVANEFFNNVSPPNPPYSWGHAYRRIRGSNSWSNHAWGLAIDIRNDLYPMGEDHMSNIKERICHGIAERHGCRWGGDYHSRKDQMHFEFMGTPADARRITAGLFESTGTTADIPKVTPQNGDDVRWITYSKDDVNTWHHGVEIIQAMLNTDERTVRKGRDNITVDGYFGSNTEERVKDYQDGMGLSVDGIVGPHTYNALLYLNIAGDQSPAFPG